MQQGLIVAITPSTNVHALDIAELYEPGGGFPAQLTAAPGVSLETPAARLDHVTETLTGYYSVAGSRVTIWAVLQAGPALQVKKQASVSGSLEDLPSLVRQLGSALGFSAQDPGTRNAGALKALAEAMEASTPEIASQKYAESVKIDPSFGPAYVNWLRWAGATRNEPAYQQALTLANAQKVSPLSRAQVAGIAAEIEGDPTARLAALKQQVALDPADPAALRGLADAETTTHQFGSAVGHLEKAVSLVPDSPELRNVLAYAYLFAGDEANARVQAKEYQKFALESGNPLDTLGDVEFHFNHFTEAEKYYGEAFRADAALTQASSLSKAAACELMRGDLKKADAIHANYIRALTAKQDPLAGLRHADWLFQTGRRAEAIAIATQFSRLPIPPVLQSLAHTRLAAWHLQMGDAAGARQEAKAALATDPMARLVDLLGQPLDSADFAQKVEAIFPGPGNQQRRLLAQGYRTLIDKDFGAGEKVWKQIAETGNEPTADVVYAWMLIESGKKAEAATLLRTTPLWHENQVATLSEFWFPKLFSLRAAVSTGSEAERNRQIYQLLGGGA